MSNVFKARVAITESKTYNKTIYIEDAEAIKAINNLDENDPEYNDKLDRIVYRYLGGNISEIPLGECDYVDGQIDCYDVISVEECNEPTEIVWLVEDIKLEVNARIKHPVNVTVDKKDEMIELYKKEYHNRISRYAGSAFHDSSIQLYDINNVSISAKDAVEEDDTNLSRED